jgi:hypothetical protein
MIVINQENLSVFICSRQRMQEVLVGVDGRALFLTPHRWHVSSSVYLLFHDLQPHLWRFGLPCDCAVLDDRVPAIIRAYPHRAHGALLDLASKGILSDLPSQAENLPN